MLIAYATHEFAGWYERLPRPDLDAVHHGVELLQLSDGALPDGYDVRAVPGATFALFELKLYTNARPLRLFYVSDRRRRILLLIGGDRRGLLVADGDPATDSAFYRHLLRWATAVWAEYRSLPDLPELEGGAPLSSAARP